METKKHITAAQRKEYQKYSTRIRLETKEALQIKAVKAGKPDYVLLDEILSKHLKVKS